MKKVFPLQISLGIGYFCATNCIATEAKSLSIPTALSNVTSLPINSSTKPMTNSPLLAQVTTDGTVNTQIDRQGSVTEIRGGETRDSNLFHSFQDFSVEVGNEAVFNNASNISNIFSRVTGGNVSNIDGLIRANGSANLFLLNPAGIIFGENARLDLGGSFVGSTANDIVFADGTSFSADDTQADPVLTVSVPVGLQLGQNSGKIVVLGNGNDLSVTDPIFSPIIFGQQSGLRVKPDRTLALVARGINLNGGTIAAPGGRIELGSVNGLVAIDSTDSGFSLGYENITALDKIQLQAQALADVSGTASIPSGSIQVRGQQLTLNNGSLLLGQNIAEAKAGDINLDLSELITISGTNPDSTIRSSITNETLGIGDGGNIKISTSQLIVDSGASIVAKTLSPAGAASGNLEIDALESIDIIGASSLDPSVTSAVVTASFGAGDSGNNNITTDSLIVSRGGTIASSTFDTGNSGDINIVANSIQLIGIEPNIFAPSGITASTLGAGNAGDLTINTSTLSLQQGGRVDASTVALGNAGSVTIEATDSIAISGTVPNSFNPSLIIASANILDPALKALFDLPDTPTGDSGNVTITTPQLEIDRGGQLTVRNDGTGDAGILKVIAEKISLNDGGGITAATQVGKVGNIDLSADNIFLQGNSMASAQTVGQEDGGNITLNTNNLVLLEGSQLTADANQGRGGNIQIDTQGLFDCEECQVTASSRLGVDGVVEINTLQPNSHLNSIDLSQQASQLEEIVVVACPARSPDNTSQLTIKGRGGLPPRPQEALNSRAIVSFDNSDARSRKSASSDRQNSQLPSPARSWYTDKRGTVILSAKASSNTLNNSPQTTYDCQANR